MDHGYAVHLVNTSAIPQYDGLKHGDEHSDALHLAQLMRPGLFRRATFIRASNAPRATRCDVVGIGPDGEAIPGTEGLSRVRRALHAAAPCLSAHSCRVAIG